MPTQTFLQMRIHLLDKLHQPFQLMYHLPIIKPQVVYLQHQTYEPIYWRIPNNPSGAIPSHPRSCVTARSTSYIREDGTSHGTKRTLRFYIQRHCGEIGCGVFLPGEEPSNHGTK